MNLNKGISTPIAILIIVVVAVLAGEAVWQYGKVKEAKLPEIETAEEVPQIGEQREEKNEMRGTIKEGGEKTLSYYFQSPKLISESNSRNKVINNKHIANVVWAAESRSECRVSFIRAFILWGNEENELDLTLISPDDSKEYKAKYDSPALKSLTINNPQQGNWTIKVYGKKVIGKEEEYTVMIFTPGSLMSAKFLSWNNMPVKYPIKWDWEATKMVKFQVAEDSGRCRLLDVTFRASNFTQENGKDIISGDSFSFSPNRFKVNPDSSKDVEARLNVPSNISSGKYSGKIKVTSGENKTTFPVTVMLK